MLKHLLTFTCIAIIISSCVTTSHTSRRVSAINADTALIEIPINQQPDSLTNLDRNQFGGFILTPGFYQATFKTFCLEPGTPDPVPGNAYVHAAISGYRADIVESVLLNSRRHSSIDQKNVQLLLWSIVSGSDFNKLSPGVRMDAQQLLTPKQIFELKGGIVGLVRSVSNNLPTNSTGVKKLFDMGTSSYEAYEKIAVINEPAKEFRADFKYDQWYKQDGYFVRYFPESYKRVRVQVYVPETLNTSDYVVFDPTGTQVIPANSNAQRLGIGGVLVDVIRKVIIVNTKKEAPRKPEPGPKPRPERKHDPKQVPGKKFGSLA